MNSNTLIYESGTANKQITNDSNMFNQALMLMAVVMSDMKRKIESLSNGNNRLPFNEKYSLSVEEAAVYFGIGEKRLRQIAYEHRGDSFILEIGTHIRFKRVLFEEFLNDVTMV